MSIYLWNANCQSRAVLKNLLYVLNAIGGREIHRTCLKHQTVYNQWRNPYKLILVMQSKVQSQVTGTHKKYKVFRAPLELEGLIIHSASEEKGEAFEARGTARARPKAGQCKPYWGTPLPLIQTSFCVQRAQRCPKHNLRNSGLQGHMQRCSHQQPGQRRGNSLTAEKGHNSEPATEKSKALCTGSMGPAIETVSCLLVRLP